MLRPGAEGLPDPMKTAVNQNDRRLGKRRKRASVSRKSQAVPTGIIPPVMPSLTQNQENFSGTKIESCDRR